MVGLESFMAIFFLRRAVSWADLIRVGVTTVCTYAHWFWWHFRVGIKTGASRAEACNPALPAPTCSSCHAAFMAAFTPRCRRCMPPCTPFLLSAADGDAFMFVDFQKTIIGNGHYDPAAPKPPFWSTFFYLNREMLRANASIMQRHPWETVWWEWILNLRGLLYYSYDLKHTYTQGMYLIGERRRDGG